MGNDGGINSQKSKQKESKTRNSIGSLLLDHIEAYSPAAHDLKKSSSKSNLNSSSPSNSRRKSSSDDESGLLDPANLPGVQPHVQQVPSIVVACTRYLEENGLHTVGIFRVSTSKKRVRQVSDEISWRFESERVKMID